MAPEMLEEQSYDESVDWWALGVMPYCLLTGKFPFDAEDEIDLTLDILGAPLYIPEFLSSDVEDCLTKFLERTPQLRLGYQKGCFPSPMHEPFFSDVEWGKIFNEELNPPFVPLLQNVVSETFKGNDLYLYRVTCNRIFSFELNTPVYMGH
ncbi:ribosomal protein S6 kinase beta-2-like [Acropora muricata]|uniref:ribosomal protein S6 kinase beta-2-like n=1 Tax=Acropora muricata TaxID=159855 RepID=UPI0034E55622